MLVVTTALMSDYNFRGITQSNHNPSVQGGFEARYNWTPTFQSYVGLSGESIDFPNNAAAEVDLYAGIRPTFDKLALDFGFWEYYYPGGNCYSTNVGPTTCDRSFGGATGAPPSQVLGAAIGSTGNATKANDSFWEVYAKATYTINDQWAPRHSGMVLPERAQPRRLGLVFDRQRDLHGAFDLVPERPRDVRRIG